MIFLQLFYEFFKVGLFAIGGGLATLPFLYDLSARTNWFTSAQLADMIAVSESTPGPIGVNMATYGGFNAAGILGGVVATLGLITPSIIIILIVAKFLKRFSEAKLVKDVFYGLRPATAALIAAAGFQVVKISLLNLELFLQNWNFAQLFQWKALILFALLMFLTNKFKKHPVVYIAGAAVVGIVVQL